MTANLARRCDLENATARSVRSNPPHGPPRQPARSPGDGEGIRRESNARQPRRLVHSVHCRGPLWKCTRNRGRPDFSGSTLTQPCSNRWQNAQNERLAQALSGCGLAPVPVRIGCGFCRSRRVNDVQPFRVERNLEPGRVLVLLPMPISPSASYNAPLVTVLFSKGLFDTPIRKASPDSTEK